MIFRLISSFLIADEIDQPSKKNVVHLVSRPFKVPPGPRVDRIYTTRVIAEILKKQNSDLNNNAVIILSASTEGTRLKLPNGVKIIVRVVESSSAAENVMFLIETNGRQMLYSGLFNEYKCLLNNEFAWHCIQNSLIDVVYIDNKCPSKQCTIDDVCEFILSIKRKNPQHALLIGVNEFGYDDIPHMLQTKYRCDRISVDCTYLDYLENFPKSTDDIAGIKFVDADHELNAQEIIKNDKEDAILRMNIGSFNNQDELGVAQVWEGAGYFINYNNHATHQLIYGLLNWTCPRDIVQIYEDGPEIPDHFHDLCKR